MMTVFAHTDQPVDRKKTALTNTPLPTEIGSLKLLHHVTVTDNLCCLSFVFSANPVESLPPFQANMAAALGLVQQINRISVRYLLPRVSQLKCCHNMFSRQNYGLAKLRLMSTEPERTVQIKNGKVKCRYY